MTTYKMTPKANGTRGRIDHNTFAEIIIRDFVQGEVLTGSEFWTAPADGVEVKKLDKWLYVTARSGNPLPQSVWVAYTHKGVPICEGWTEVPDVEPPAETIFPPAFTLTPEGSAQSARYVFDKVL